MTNNESKAGVVVLPIDHTEGTSVYFWKFPPREEDKAKKVESSLARLDEMGLREVSGEGLPGGGVEEGQTILEAAWDEWYQETNQVPITDFEGRIIGVMENVPIYQERPAPTDFGVFFYLLYLEGSEGKLMRESGASLAVLDLLTGSITNASDGSAAELRPAHADLLYLFAGCAMSFALVGEEVINEQTYIA